MVIFLLIVSFRRKSNKNFYVTVRYLSKMPKHDSFYTIFFFCFWIFFFFADYLKSIDLVSYPNSQRNNNVNKATTSKMKIQNNNKKINIINKFDNNTNRSQLIQITSSSSSLPITAINESAIKRLSKKTKNRSKYAKTNKKHCKKRRR